MLTGPNCYSILYRSLLRRFGRGGSWVAKNHVWINYMPRDRFPLKLVIELLAFTFHSAHCFPCYIVWSLQILIKLTHYTSLSVTISYFLFTQCSFVPCDPSPKTNEVSVEWFVKRHTGEFSFDCYVNPKAANEIILDLPDALAVTMAMVWPSIGFVIGLVAICLITNRSKVLHITD